MREKRAREKAGHWGPGRDSELWIMGEKRAREKAGHWGPGRDSEL